MDTQKNNVESEVYSAHHDVASLNLVPFAYGPFFYVRLAVYPVAESRTTREIRDARSLPMTSIARSPARLPEGRREMLRSAE